MLLSKIAQCIQRTPPVKAGVAAATLSVIAIVAQVFRNYFSINLPEALQQRASEDIQAPWICLGAVKMMSDGDRAILRSQCEASKSNPSTDIASQLFNLYQGKENTCVHIHSKNAKDAVTALQKIRETYQPTKLLEEGNMLPHPDTILSKIQDQATFKQHGLDLFSFPTIDCYTNHGINLSNPPLKSSPAYLTSFSRPGLALVGNGEQGYSLNTVQGRKPAELVGITLAISAEFKRRHGDPKVENGMRLEVRPDGGPVISLGLPTQGKKKQEQIMKYLDKAIPDASFYEISYEKFRDLLMTINHGHVKGSLDPALMSPFRSVYVIITNNDRMPRAMNEINLAENAPLESSQQDSSETVSLHSVLEKMKKFIQTDKNTGQSTIKYSDAIQSFTPGERDLFNRQLATIVLDPKEIESHLKQSWQTVQHAYRDMLIQGKIDHVALATFLMRQILSIHPFLDGNGRTARDLFNRILAIQGINPPVIWNKDEYYRQVQAEMERPGSFIAYLKEIIAWSDQNVLKLTEADLPRHSTETP